MSEPYRTAAKQATAVYEEKKSRFHAAIRPVHSQAEAMDFVALQQTEHPTAAHHVFAYILPGTNTARCSDDGEPSGTAGMPVLEVIRREGLSGVSLVVTRYFGGILLGAGGLVRAYAKSAKLAVDAAGIACYVPLVAFTLTIGYSHYERVRVSLPQYGVQMTNADFKENVVLQLLAAKQDYARFCEFVLEETGGRAIVKETGEQYGIAAQS